MLSSFKSGRHKNGILECLWYWNANLVFSPQHLYKKTPKWKKKDKGCYSMGSKVFFTGTKWPGCEVHCLLPVESQVKKFWQCTTLSSTKILHGLARYKLNFYYRIYILFVYRSTWYGCKLRLDNKLPAAHAFLRIAYRLSPTSLFRELKYITVYSTQLLKVN